MLMIKKELVAVWGGLLLAGAACGVTDVVSQTFEAATTGAAATALTDTTVATWTGNGTIAELAYDYTSYAAGLVFQGSDVTHAKVLSIDDSVLCTPATAISTSSALVDMMVQAMVPEDALTAPTDTEVQIAVGVDKPTSSSDDTESSTGVLKVYCTPKGGSTAAWCTLKEVAAGTWHRVTFVFDYETGYAQVRIDGEPIMSASGYLTANTANTAETADGSWYKLAASKTTLTSVEVVGTTGLDDLRIASGTDAVEAATVAGTNESGVPYAWYDKYGLAWSSTTAYDNSGMTLLAKYETGLSPFDGETFTLKKMAMSGSNATFTIPAMTPPTGYSVKLVYSTKPDFSENKKSVDVTSGATSVEVTDLPDATVYYYRLETVSAQ